MPRDNLTMRKLTKQIVIHESATQAMDFTAKNFRYVTTGFGEFAQRVEKGDRLYLRALSHEKPTEHPALLAEDFPSLAPDFVLPPQLSLVEENLFSSVLRMSGPVNMWLHYDVSLSLSFSFPPSPLTQGAGHGQRLLPNKWFKKAPALPTIGC